MVYFCTSLFGASSLELRKSIDIARKASADYLHVDVMDGYFTEDFGFSIKSVREITEITNMPIDVHIMTLEPERFIDRFVELKINSISFHVEMVKDVIGCINKIKKHGIKSGIAVSPEISIDFVEEYFQYFDEAIIMAIKPGYSGEKFNNKCLEKIEQLAARVKKLYRKLNISVDGSIGIAEAKKCIEKGANKIIVGRAFFQADNPIAFSEKLRSIEGENSEGQGRNI